MRQPNTFDHKSVVEYFDEDAFRQVSEKMLIDFLPDIHASQIPVLSTWKQHFIDIGVPFAITKYIDTYQDNGRTRRVDRYVLWKPVRI